jgi:aspartate ammonia-lyase
VQAGSSIMPGTVNPVLAEAAHQVAFGDRHAVTTTMAAEDGQHHLNAFEPIVRPFVSEFTPAWLPVSRAVPAW